MHPLSNNLDEVWEWLLENVKVAPEKTNKSINRSITRLWWEFKIKVS